MVVEDKRQARLKCLQQKIRASRNNYNEKRITIARTYRKNKEKS